MNGPDPDLPLFEPPARIPAWGLEEPAMALTTPAAVSPILTEGGHAAVLGTGRNPVEQLLMGGRVVLTRPILGDTAVANLLLSPGRLRCERVGPAGMGTQSVLVVDALPLVALGWTGVGGPGGRFRCTILPGCAEVRYHIGSACVTARTEDPAKVVAVALVPPPLALTATPLDAGGIALEATLATDGLTVLVTTGDPERCRRALGTAAHLPAHERRVGRTEEDGGLVLRSGVDEIDEGVAWMRARLRASLLREAAAPRSPAAGASLLWSGIGAAAIGDAGAARAAYRRLREAAPTAAGLLAGRLALTFGDQGPALSIAERLLTHVPSAPGDPLGDASLRRIALLTLADALRDRGSAALIAELRAQASRIPEPPGAEGPRGGASTRPGGKGGMVRLPTVTRGAVLDPAPIRKNVPDGGRGEVGWGDWLALALAAEPLPPPPDTTAPDLRRALQSWSGFSGRPEEGWAAWREMLASGLRRGPAGPGSWDPVAGQDLGDGTPVAGALLGSLAHGLLGIAPDAPSGRLRLAPRLPSHLNHFTVEGIVVGDARIHLRYDRSDGTTRFAFDPVEGRIPPMLLFEPSVTGEVGEIRLDDRPAELDRARQGGRTTTRIQIPLDRLRVVEFDEG